MTGGFVPELQVTFGGQSTGFYKCGKNLAFYKIQRKVCTTRRETASREVVLVHGENDVKSGVASRIAET